MKVLGIVTGQNKETKKPFTVLHVVGEFDDWQKNAIGQKVKELFVGGQLIPAKIGDDIEPVYDIGWGGKAIVKDVVIFNK